MASKIQTMRSGGTQHPEEIVNYLTSRMVKGEGGVFDKANGGCAVAQQSVPNMSVKVAEGYAMLRKSTSAMVYPVRIYDGVQDINIASNSSGFTRIDAIVTYIDLGASPNSDITNVAKLVVVQGTPSGSPTAPLDATIISAIGASNPWTRLANVTVANGATSIVTANISDQRTGCIFLSPETPTAAGDTANKAYVDQVIASGDGWQTSAYPYVYVSAQSLKVVGSNVTSIFTKGTKIKLTNNSAVKTYYVVSSTFSADTTITLSGEVDLVTGAITLPFYSYMDNPQGFKKKEDWFCARAKRTSTQTINDNTFTKVELNTEEYDPNSNFDKDTNFRYTAPISGLYSLNGKIFAYDSSEKLGVLKVGIYKNGSLIDTITATPSNTYSMVIFAVSISMRIQINKGDYIELFVLGDTTDSGTFIIGPSATEMCYLDIVCDGI